jgi:hypothetical protein
MQRRHGKHLGHAHSQPQGGGRLAQRVLNAAPEDADWRRELAAYRS